jgi:gas vesicle protein
MKFEQRFWPGSSFGFDWVEQTPFPVPRILLVSDSVALFAQGLSLGSTHRHSKREDEMKSFLVGLGLGVGLGLLFAPMSGEETRNNLADRANDLANTARDTYEQNRDRVQRGVETIRGTAERAVGQVRNTVKETARATGTENSSPSPQHT